MPLDVYLNVAIGGVLTGLVYGLMALGLSVIFGVVRVVNFAHGEMMTIAMFLAVVLCAGAASRSARPARSDRGGDVRASAMRCSAALINPFITRPEHSQFLLLVALAIIITNTLLIVFGPDARTVQTAYGFDSFQFGPIIVDAAKVYAGIGRDRVRRRVVRVLPLHADRQGDPRLRRQSTPARWWSGSTSSASTRSPSGSARPASAPPAR